MTEVRARRIWIEAEIARLNSELKELQVACTHPPKRMYTKAIHERDSSAPSSLVCGDCLVSVRLVYDDELCRDCFNPPEACSC